MSEFLLQSPGADEAIRRPRVAVAVVMRREAIVNRWQPWRWSLADIVPHQDSFGSQPRLLLKDDQEERWLHPGFNVELFTDDAEGYYLNVSTPQPCFWVVWRMEEEAVLADEPVAGWTRRKPSSRLRRHWMWSSGCRILSIPTMCLRPNVGSARKASNPWWIGLASRRG